MLTIQKLSLQTGSKLFTSKQKRYIRIQYQNLLIKSTANAKFINQTSIQWDQIIQLPSIYQQEMNFQIYQQHKFGYNPQEIQNVLKGKMTFSQNNQKYNNWEVYDGKNRKVGYLTASLKSRPQVSQISQMKSNTFQMQNNGAQTLKKWTDSSQLLTVSSIVINMPILKTRRAYALITAGQQSLKTSSIKSRTGQLVFIDKYELQRKQQISEGQIAIFLHNDNREEKVAYAKVLFGDQIERKLKFYDLKGNQIGDGFIDASLDVKSQVLAGKMLTSMIKKSFQKQNTVSQSRNLAKSVLSHNINSSRNLSSLDLSSSRNRPSVISGNNNIRIPQQKRFFLPSNPANNKCSYLPQQSFQFKQKRVNKYYRGASFGYGGKADFVEGKRQLPGVGKYKLPSIWDRY